MIPREILKKIRQIELRTNRLVTGFATGARVCDPQHARIAHDPDSSERALSGEAAAGRRPALRLFQPAAQCFGITRAMPDGADNQFGSLAFDNEVNGIRPRVWHFGFLGQPTGEGKSFRVLANHFEKSPQLVGEPLADSRLAFVIEVDGLGKFLFCFLLNDDPETHRLARNRFSISATTSSSGRQRSGCASARSARRSSSAICSGVSSSSNRLRSCSKTSRCSSNGSLSTCSITCVALMAAIYSFDSLAQAGFFHRANSSFVIRHSSFPPP